MVGLASALALTAVTAFGCESARETSPTTRPDVAGPGSCGWADVDVAVGPEDFATSMASAVLVLQNRSPSACTVPAYVGVRLLRAGGPAVAVSRSAPADDVLPQPTTVESCARAVTTLEYSYRGGQGALEEGPAYTTAVITIAPSQEPVRVVPTGGALHVYGDHVTEGPLSLLPAGRQIDPPPMLPACTAER